MARSRNIKPGFFTNEVLGSLDPLARILFAGMWCHADREGRLEDRMMRLKPQVLPYDNCDIEHLAQCLHDAGMVQRYVVDGKRYIQVCEFKKHQNPHMKEQASTIPAPDKHHASTSVARLIPDSLNPITDSLNLIPDSSPPLALNPKPDKPKPHSEARAKKPRALSAPTNETWDSYSNAYADRYQVTPVRNAKVNGMLARLVERIGAQEAPAVAAYYVGHRQATYTRARHCVDLLLRDAEALRMEWATQRQITGTEARMSDETAARGNVFNKLIAEIENEQQS